VQLLGAHAHPEVSLHSHSLADYMQRIYGTDWPGVAELMLASADKLAKAGAYGRQALPELRLRRTAPAAGAVIGGRRSASGQSAAVRAALVKNASRPPAVRHHAAVADCNAAGSGLSRPTPELTVSAPIRSSERPDNRGANDRSQGTADIAARSRAATKSAWRMHKVRGLQLALKSD
jgi:hypothetical protein